MWRREDNLVHCLSTSQELGTLEKDFGIFHQIYSMYLPWQVSPCLPSESLFLVRGNGDEEAKLLLNSLLPGITPRGVKLQVDPLSPSESLFLVRGNGDEEAKLLLNSLLPGITPRGVKLQVDPLSPSESLFLVRGKNDDEEVKLVLPGITPRGTRLESKVH